MAKPLEANVKETFHAVIVGRRNAKSHPTNKLKVNPHMATDHLIYELGHEGMQARIMVSTSKIQEIKIKPYGIYSEYSKRVNYQNVAIMVKGAVPYGIIDAYAQKLATTLGVIQSDAVGSKYVGDFADFLGGTVHAREEAVRILRPDQGRKSAPVPERKLYQRPLDGLM